MLEVCFIFVLSLMPFAFSRLLLYRAMREWENTLDRVRAETMFRYERNVRVNLDEFARDLATDDTYCIGNDLCFYNARSPYLRCAVNPEGPCEDCIHFVAR